MPQPQASEGGIVAAPFRWCAVVFDFVSVLGDEVLGVEVPEQVLDDVLDAVFDDAVDDGHCVSPVLGE